jgi:hypothetical protein
MRLFSSASTIKGKSTTGTKTNATTTTTAAAARDINGGVEKETNNNVRRNGWLPKLMQKGLYGPPKIDDNTICNKIEKDSSTIAKVSKENYYNPLKLEQGSANIPNVLTEAPSDENATTDSIETTNDRQPKEDTNATVQEEALKLSSLEVQGNLVESESTTNNDNVLPVNDSSAPITSTESAVNNADTKNNRPMLRPPRQSSTASRVVKFTPPMAKTTSLVMSRSSSNSQKPSPVIRAATENSNASLHRRQQPMIVFDFDTASLHRIVSDNDDNNDTMKNERTPVPLNLNLPKTMDATMRAVSAMTMCSDDGDCNLVLDDDYDDDNSIDITSANAILETKLEPSPTSSSPVSVVDDDAVAVSPTNANNNNLPAWMQQWASLEVRTNDTMDYTAMASKEEIDSIPVEDLHVFECSATTASMQYSCSTGATESNENDTVQSVSYIPSVPYPPCKDSKSISPRRQESIFQGWVAASCGSSSDDGVIFNDDTVLSSSALRYTEILSTPMSTSSGPAFAVSLTDVNGTESLITFSANNCRVSIHSISARKGNCLEISDDNNRLCLLPVHVTKSMLLQSKSNDNCCERFFMPFKNEFVAASTNGAVFYAPDGQVDATLHLRFILDVILSQVTASSR